MASQKAATQPLLLCETLEVQQAEGKAGSSSRLWPSLQSWPGASLPSLLSLLAHQTSTASSKTRGFPILPASSPSAGAGQKCCSQQVILPPPRSSEEQAAPASAGIRGHSHWDRKRHPCPLSSWKKLTVVIREGTGRTQVLCLGHPASSDNRAMARGQGMSCQQSWAAAQTPVCARTNL